jgi:hypothetical protein
LVGILKRAFLHTYTLLKSTIYVLSLFDALSALLDEIRQMTQEGAKDQDKQKKKT